MRVHGRILGGLLLLTGILAPAISNAGCVTTPAIYGGINDVVKCTVHYFGKNDLQFLLGATVCGNSGTLPGVPPIDPMNPAPFNATGCSSTIPNGLQVSDMACRICTQGADANMSSKNLRKLVDVSVCVIPAGGSRCDSVATISPPQ